MENPLLPTILSSLKEVAKIDAEVFEGDVDSVIKEFAVKKVLRKDETVSDAMNDTFNESFVRIQTYSTYADPIVTVFPLCCSQQKVSLMGI